MPKTDKSKIGVDLDITIKDVQYPNIRPIIDALKKTVPKNPKVIKVSPPHVIENKSPKPKSIADKRNKK
jgi:hypothetical protein